MGKTTYLFKVCDILNNWLDSIKNVLANPKIQKIQIQMHRIGAYFEYIVNFMQNHFKHVENCMEIKIKSLAIAVGKNIFDCKMDFTI